MISVVVPARNAGQTLATCLAALAAQQAPHPEFETIVVDDGSTDDTANVAEDGSARVLRQDARGPAAARNLGVANARGDIIVFTDADCRPASDFIAALTAPMVDPDVIGVKGVYATEQRAPLARLAQLEFEERYERLEHASHLDFFDTHACALRRSALNADGTFDAFFPSANSEDLDLAYRLAARGARLAFTRRARVYHNHPETWARYMRQKFSRGYWRMHVYRRYPDKMISDSYTPQLLKAQIAMTALVPAALAASLLWPQAAWVAAGALALLLASGFGMYRLAWRRDRGVLPLAPLFIVARALALGAGVALGILTVARLVPVANPRV